MTAKRSIMVGQVQVHVIGASGRTGTALCRSLLADGVPIVPVVRDAGCMTHCVTPRTSFAVPMRVMPAR
jgi:hypothetical protein